MTLDEAISEWERKKRRMGCVSAVNWLCRRVPGFTPIRLRRYLPGGTDKNGLLWEHVVATNGRIVIDIAPYSDGPK